LVTFKFCAENKPVHVSTPSGLPAGFFDTYTNENEEEAQEEEEEEEAEQQDSQPTLKKEEIEPPAEPSKSAIPKGFFDDPTLDAKMRGAKTPAKLKEEEIDKIYEKYQESISDDLKQAEKIQVELLMKDESVEDGTDDIELVDREQERKEMEQKMLDLKKKSDRIKELKEKLATKPSRVLDVGEDDLISPDAFYDWRAKSSKLINT